MNGVQVIISVLLVFPGIFVFPVFPRRVEMCNFLLFLDSLFLKFSLTVIFSWATMLYVFSVYNHLFYEFFLANLFFYLKDNLFWFPAKVLRHQIQNFFGGNLSLNFSADSKFFIVFLAIF